MKRTFVILLVIVLSSLLLGFSFSDSSELPDPKSITLKLREVGNQLYLDSKDSISLVLPIKKLDQNEYVLEFESELSINPDSLISHVQKNLTNIENAENYLVEVLNESNEISYSFKISEEENALPCLGRILPESSYKIRFHFLAPTKNDYQSLIARNSHLVSILFLGFLGIGVYHNRRNKRFGKLKEVAPGDNNFVIIGNSFFYPDKNLLIVNDTKYSLTNTEGELLKILSDRLNEIVKREIITEMLWGDRGVVVGRSLDTFIFRLRKKLKQDTSVSLENARGVGYGITIQDK